MKVTKGQVKAEDRKVIAFYTEGALVFRDMYSGKNYVLNDGNTIYEGYLEFENYLKLSRELPDFIAFYEGDTIIIEL